MKTKSELSNAATIATVTGIMLICIVCFFAALSIWPASKPAKINHRDYQIEVKSDSIYMYDESRLVKTFPLRDGKDSLSTAIIEDNQ